MVRVQLSLFCLWQLMVFNFGNNNKLYSIREHVKITEKHADFSDLSFTLCDATPEVKELKYLRRVLTEAVGGMDVRCVMDLNKTTKVLNAYQECSTDSIF